MSADYAPAVWIPTAHFWAGWDQPPRFVVLHETEDDSPAEAIARYFQTTTRETSTHFIVDRAGNVAQSVSLTDRAWGNGLVTAGALPYFVGTNPNHYTVSIEICKANGAVVMTDVQRDAVFRLVRFVVDRFNLPRRVIRSSKLPDANGSGGVVGHCDIDPKNKSFDPGVFPYEDLLAYLEQPEGPAPMMILPNFPFKEQRTEKTKDGRPPENGTYDCVATSFASAIEFLIHLKGDTRWVSGDELKDEEYGEGWVNTGTALSRYVDDASDRARHDYGVTALSYKNNDTWALVRHIHAELQRGRPVLVTIPSSWGTVYPISQRLVPWNYFSTHVIVFYSEEGGLTAMNPWGAMKHTGSDQYWADRLCAGEVWTADYVAGSATVAIPLDIKQVAGFFTSDANQTVWTRKDRPDISIRGGHLVEYRKIGFPYGTVPFPGLPTGNEVKIGSELYVQPFERAIMVYDNGNPKFDAVPGWAVVYYPVHIDDDRVNFLLRDARAAAKAAQDQLGAAKTAADQATAAKAAAEAALNDAKNALAVDEGRIKDLSAKLAEAQHAADAADADLAAAQAKIADFNAVIGGLDAIRAGLAAAKSVVEPAQDAGAKIDAALAALPALPPAVKPAA